jgi:hypothetical protein
MVILPFFKPMVPPNIIAFDVLSMAAKQNGEQKPTW